nr:methylenetetrahydrofolate reductase [Candidatus Coxiella mudrowiae]
MQYFYTHTHDAYFYFLENCQKLHVNIHIIPGIMPIN